MGVIQRDGWECVGERNGAAKEVQGGASDNLGMTVTIIGMAKEDLCIGDEDVVVEMVHLGGSEGSGTDEIAKVKMMGDGAKGSQVMEVVEVGGECGGLGLVVVGKLKE